MFEKRNVRLVFTCLLLIKWLNFQFICTPFVFIFLPKSLLILPKFCLCNVSKLSNWSYIIVAIKSLQESTRKSSSRAFMCGDIVRCLCHQHNPFELLRNVFVNCFLFSQERKHEIRWNSNNWFSCCSLQKSISKDCNPKMFRSNKLGLIKQFFLWLVPNKQWTKSIILWNVSFICLTVIKYSSKVLESISGNYGLNNFGSTLFFQIKWLNSHLISFSIQMGRRKKRTKRKRSNEWILLWRKLAFAHKQIGV